MSTEPFNDGPQGYDWEVALATLKRRRGLIAKVVAVGVAATFVLIFIAAPSYRSVARLLVDPTYADVPVTARADTGVVIDRTADLRLMSSVALLQSELLLREVLSTDASLYEDEEEAGSGGLGGSAAGLDDLHPVVEAIMRLAGMALQVSHIPGALYATLHEVPPATELDEAVATIHERLEVRRIAGSSLIEVSYADKSPRRAARVVNSLLDYFVSEAARLPEQEDDAMRFFNEQHQLLGERVDVAKAALREFLEFEGAGILLESEEEQRSILADLRHAEVDARAEMAEIDGQLGQLMAEVAKLPPSRTRDLRMERSEAVQSLKQRIVELELQRDELLSRYTADSIHVRDIERQRDHAIEMLVAEKTASVSSEAVLDPTLQALELDLVKARTRKVALQAKLASLDSEIGAYESRLDRRDVLALDRARLEHELALASEAYRVYRRKEEEARFELALRQSQIMSVAVVERAIPANTPESGRKRLKLMLGVFFSLMAGVGLAFVLDFGRENDSDGGEQEGLDEIDGFPTFPELDHAAVGVAASVGARPGMLLRTARHVGGAILAVAALTAAAVILVDVLASMDEPPAPVVSAAPVSEPEVASIAGLVVTRSRPASSRPLAAPSADALLAKGTPRARQRQQERPFVSRQPSSTVVSAGTAAAAPVIAAPVAVAVAEPEVPAVLAIAPAAPAPATSAAVRAPVTRVTVERGATFYSLVRRVYGAYDDELVELVVRANPDLRDVRRLEVGNVLTFPARD